MKMKSQAQRDAQINAMEAARGAAARRAQARRDEERAQAERDRAAAEHVHSWSDAGYDFDASPVEELRRCKCGALDRRPVRL